MPLFIFPAALLRISCQRQFALRCSRHFHRPSSFIATIRLPAIFAARAIFAVCRHDDAHFMTPGCQLPRQRRQFCRLPPSPPAIDAAAFIS